MTDLVVYPSERPLVGSVPVPGDKSIAHRAILLSGLASGKSRVLGGALGEDNRATLGALRAMGIESTEEESGALIIEGKGLYGLRAPTSPIDCGNSGTTIRLLSGVLVAQRFASVLIGDASLSRRPMERVAKPLRLRGGRIEGRIDPKRVGEITPPLQIGPLPQPNVLGPLEYDMPVASAQVKSAILLSGLYADGSTYVREPIVSRDHTERMLHALGVPVSTMASMIQLDGPAFSGELPAFSIEVPGDISSACFLIVAAQIVPQSRVTIRRVGVNPTRTGLAELVRDMGGQLGIEARGDEMSEPVADLHAAASELRAGRLGGELVTRTIDEVPILCALAARAEGTTIIQDAAELRVKESDRIATMAGVLRAFGVECEERPDGLAIQGAPNRPLKAAVIESRDDHRIAMTAAILGLVADGPTRVREADCIATSFPRFVGTMRALGARIEVENAAGGA
ncbi:3-phosphoshikimate 1-carboxyvinyltransferase [Polyangium aurulentum]|uniref:3-phosphoshikimate 1-carboxyvinyltransferase n=1 Tax=Polyangium aurulentum TaxID=2567896 RepID=UPI0010AE9347|nr:3-phosphoshikimate 1-carboxyvinyltransferase [Polyangium aurulentum]UQA59611.1 3-phosphoshikimate 1-carboxyvinyltransferase [Polyangium aurulentum]